MQIVRMIICICNRINEKAARSAITAGARSPKAVLAHNGCQFNCGKCKCEMGAFIAAEMDKNPEKIGLVAAE
ncbi:MAG: (2Fe-2S)-binding protein [Pseudomonadota bacterium]